MTGLCQCGCGKPAPISPKTDTSRGYFKGQPMSYILGHHLRKSAVDYIVDPETGCWEWQLASIRGYGQMRHNGKTRLSHHVFYERARGPIPRGLELDHLCRNRRCVNPDHLEAVSSAVNTQRSASAKLTVEDVREIRRLNDEPRAALALRYGVGATTIDAVREHRTWRNVA